MLLEEKYVSCLTFVKKPDYDINQEHKRQFQRYENTTQLTAQRYAKQAQLVTT